MEQPTKAQIKEFWIIFGFIPFKDGAGLQWYTYPDGEAYMNLPGINTKSINKWVFQYKLGGR